MKNLNWQEKYALGLKESLSIKEIMMLRDCGQPAATMIRDKSINYCIEHDIDYGSRLIPTAVVFKVTGLDLNYYYDKMLQEDKMHKLKEV